MRKLFRTLRFRLTVSYALVLSLFLSAAGGLTYALVRYQLVRHHDASLREAAAEVDRALSSARGRPPPRNRKRSSRRGARSRRWCWVTSGGCASSSSTCSTMPLKFSAPGADGGPARVSIEVKKDDGAVLLTVSNSGPGIPPEALGHIFERFYRVDGARPYRGAEGFGLGLAIASWIVEAHDGTIAARNLEEGGVAVEVTFRPHYG